jgi:hypothetical protein
MIPDQIIRTRPLRLSRRQIEVIQGHSRFLPPQWRRRFLHNVSDQLMGLHDISDVDVTHACSLVLRRMGSSAA